MPEQQTPAPMPGRSYYGFLLYIFGWTSIFCYLTWALVPHEYLNQLGISYLPQRYWALALPSLLLAGLLLFVGLVYPGLNLMLSAPPHDMRNLEDDKTIRREAYDAEDYFFLHRTEERGSEELTKRRRRRKEVAGGSEGDKVAGETVRAQSANQENNDARDADKSALEAGGSEGGEVAGETVRAQSANQKNNDARDADKSALESEADDWLAAVPPVYDLHISDVCQILYGGVN